VLPLARIPALFARIVQAFPHVMSLLPSAGSRPRGLSACILAYHPQWFGMVKAMESVRWTWAREALSTSALALVAGLFPASDVDAGEA